ncbi:M14 family metallopeptidase [Temperatibacter marinus]|uniref:M14 family metallopeptidase n=1 Tax=Temperatibacter marinus TaxID=1456591 RepID=A0AA52EF95_9PROT|nr:M14 family metallopeptidase [Temperatibacter marinus]WND01750.1 M14 family metallopeptidase [Temperatibacter marinus]
MNNYISIFLAVCLAVASGPVQAQAACETTDVAIKSDFESARLNGCKIAENGQIHLKITPEDSPPINPSPWYAFKVVPKSNASISVLLSYENGKHRYWPKVSTDGREWAPLPADKIEKIDPATVRLTLPEMAQPYYVAAQEMITNHVHTAWIDEMAEKSSFKKSLIGHSEQKRPIYKIESQSRNGNHSYLVIVGRQHPPEVTGALALMPFVETLMAETPLATRFRENFGIVVVPVMNPDGVALGHWRHNTRGQDLNRDWGPFKHAETQAIKNELERFQVNNSKPKDRLAMFLDFHSTGRNVLYTQSNEEETYPRDFARKWHNSTSVRFKNYKAERAERPLANYTPNQAAYNTSKNYIYRKYGVAAITYEVGDNTDRQALKEAAIIYAEEMMRLMLEELPS